MKDYLKYGAWAVVAIVLLVVVWRISRLIEGGPQTDYTVATPIDSGFVPIIKQEFKPRSTPFERASKPPVKLPQGVKESDVKRVIIVIKDVKTGSNIAVPDTSRIIELKSGEIYVPKEEGTELTVHEITYMPPILRFGLFASVGVSLGGIPAKLTVSPLVAVSPLQICGFVQFPLVMVDLCGIGAGFGFRYGNYMAGAFSHWRFDNMQRQVKISVQYAIN
jgi:hypothetical protein